MATVVTVQYSTLSKNLASGLAKEKLEVFDFGFGFFFLGQAEEGNQMLGVNVLNTFE